MKRFLASLIGALILVQTAPASALTVRFDEGAFEQRNGYGTLYWVQDLAFRYRPFYNNTPDPTQYLAIVENGALVVNPGFFVEIIRFVPNSNDELEFTLMSVDVDSTSPFRIGTGATISEFPGNNSDSAPTIQPDGSSGFQAVSFAPNGISGAGRIRIAAGATALRIDNLVALAPVPEPGTWAMLLIGFAAIGVSTRRHMAATSLDRYRKRRSA